MRAEGLRPRRGKLRGVLHHGDQLGCVAEHHPVPLAGILRRIAVIARQQVQRDLDPGLLHHRDNTFGQVLVGLIVGIGQKRDLQVIAARQVQEPVAVAVLQPRRRQMRLRALEAVGIEHGRGRVIIGRPGIKPARILHREGPLHEALAQPRPVKRLRDTHAEMLVAVQFPHRLRPRIGFAPAIARHVEVERIADRARPEGQTRGRGRIGRTLQRLDIVLRLFEVGEVTRPRHGLHVAVRPGRQPIVHLVEIGQLIARLVDLPVIGVAAQDDDVVGPMLDHDPGTHHREVHVIRRKGVAERLIALAAKGRVMRLEHVARAGAEVAIGHRIEHLLGEGRREGELELIGPENLERRARAIGLLRRAHERRDLGVHHDVVPVEVDVLGVERIAIRPLRTLDQVHRQAHPVLGPFPGPGKVRQRLQILRIDLEQRPRAGQALDHADVDAAPAIGLPGPEVPALGPAADHMAHHVAIDANPVGHVGGRVDKRLRGQPLGDGWQQPGIDEGFHEVGLVVALERLVAVHIRPVHEDRLALGLEDRGLGRRRGFHDLRQKRPGRHAQKQRRRGGAVFQSHLSSSQGQRPTGSHRTRPGVPHSMPGGPPRPARQFHLAVHRGLTSRANFRLPRLNREEGGRIGLPRTRCAGRSGGAPPPRACGLPPGVFGRQRQENLIQIVVFVAKNTPGGAQRGAEPPSCQKAKGATVTRLPSVIASATCTMGARSTSLSPPWTSAAIRA